MILKMLERRPQRIEVEKPKNYIIGVLREKSLQTKLKKWYYRPEEI
jgi:hypothetical protein